MDELLLSLAIGFAAVAGIMGAVIFYGVREWIRYDKEWIRYDKEKKKKETPFLTSELIDQVKKFIMLIKT